MIIDPKELTTHQRGVILRGICNGTALKDKNPNISENNTVITCDSPLGFLNICCISYDAEVFGLKAIFHFDEIISIEFS